MEKDVSRFKIFYPNNEWVAVMATNDEIFEAFQKKDAVMQFKNALNENVFVDFSKVLFIVNTTR